MDEEIALTIYPWPEEEIERITEQLVDLLTDAYIQGVGFGVTTEGTRVVEVIVGPDVPREIIDQIKIACEPEVVSFASRLPARIEDLVQEVERSSSGDHPSSPDETNDSSGGESPDD